MYLNTSLFKKGNYFVSLVGTGVESSRFSHLVSRWSSLLQYLVSHFCEVGFPEVVFSVLLSRHLIIQTIKTHVPLALSKTIVFLSFPSCHLSTSSGQFTDDDAPPIPWSVECDEQIVFTKGLLCCCCSSFSNILFSSLLSSFTVNLASSVFVS